MKTFVRSLAPFAYMGAVLLLIGVLRAQVNPCDTGETPCNPNKGWMRGTIEKSCANPKDLAAFRARNPDRTILECHCQHTCDPMNEHTAETDRRGWDNACAARCSPSNCACEHPCES